MSFVDQQYKSSDELESSGATPLTRGEQQQSYDSAAGENTSQEAASSGPASMEAGNDQPQGLSSNKKAPKSSSGMFTNIQKYVEKNRPQAQKIAGAVTGDISKQAGEIRKVAEQKQAQQNAALQANQEALDTARSSATAAVNQITAPQQETTQPAASAEDFQKYMAGDVAGVNQVQDIDLSKQQLRTDALSQLAKGAQTEQGRRNLLGQTFQKQGDYTRGMAGLDQLITSGDKTARESLVSGIKDTAGQLGTDLGSIQEAQRAATGAQSGELRDFGGDVRSLAQDPYKTLQDEAAARAQRIGALDIGSTISDEDLAATGLTRAQVENLYGVDPTAAFGTRGATADQIARMGGLSELLGQDAPAFEEFKTQDFLDQVAAQKALYEKDFTEGSRKSAADAINKQWSGNTSYYNALMRELDSLYDTGVSTAGDDSGLGGWAANRIQGNTWDEDAGKTVTYKDLYDKVRKQEEARVRDEYKYGQGLTSGEEDQLYIPTSSGVKSGGSRRS